MPPPKNKGKGGGGKSGKAKQKGKSGKAQGGGGHGGAKSNKPHKPKDAPKQQQQPNVRQHQELLHTKMLESIADMYKAYADKHEHMRTFFGIFTKHNQLQLRELMKAAIPDINQHIEDKFLKHTQNDDHRDLNQFIFLGDIVIGAFATELVNSQKDLNLAAFCILPYFRNFGFGSRLMVHLITNCVSRKKLGSISVRINEENTKAVAFFTRFGFKPFDKDGEETLKNGTNTSKEEKTKEEDINCVVMRLDLRLYRSSLLVLAKKQLKEESAPTEHDKED